MYLNEEGKLSGLPVNVTATALTRDLLPAYDVIVGDVILLGPPDDEGNDTDALIEVGAHNEEENKS